MKIKKYSQFLEAISGTELVGKHMGPNYPEQDNSPMKRIGLTDVIYSDVLGKVVTQDEFQDLYFKYLQTKQNLTNSSDDFSEVENNYSQFNKKNLEFLASVVE